MRQYQRILKNNVYTYIHSYVLEIKRNFNLDKLGDITIVKMENKLSPSFSWIHSWTIFSFEDKVKCLCEFDDYDGNATLIQNFPQPPDIISNHDLFVKALYSNGENAFKIPEDIRSYIHELLILEILITSAEDITLDEYRAREIGSFADNLDQFEEIVITALESELIMWVKGYYPFYHGGNRAAFY